MSATSSARLVRTVCEANTRDAYRGIVRLDPDDLAALGANAGDIIAFAQQAGGAPASALRALPTLPNARGRGVALDSTERRNLKVSVGDPVYLWRTAPPTAKRLELVPLQADPVRQSDVLQLLLDRAVVAGGQVRLELYGKRVLEFIVNGTAPDSPVLVGPDTRLVMMQPRVGSAPLSSYEDIGGLSKEVARIRELVELPLRYPDIFDRMGVEPPRGVLLTGPPGTGKTLIARAVAREAGAHFISVAGPEIVGKFYGESEKRLRDIFAQASKRTPSIIFLDEIDAIGPKRSEVQGEVEKRVVGQLLALMDGLDGRGQVLVIGATNRPDDLDPALRRPGRFEREVSVGVPDQAGRLEILQVHTRSMPLGDDVSLGDLAARTYGFVGADLAALCREAALERIRLSLPRWSEAGALADILADVAVTRSDFEQALRYVTPSALREMTSEMAPARWQDVGGLGDIKTQLKELVELPFNRTELFREMQLEPPKGVLLAGPPGTGKTLVARVIANEIAANFILVRGAQFLSKYVGESERAVRDLFSRARANAPCIVFFDEIDAFLGHRDHGDAVSERIVGQFLAEMDGALAVSGVVVLGATNRPASLDPALVRSGRFETVLHFGLPTLADREAIIGVHLRDRPTTGDLDLASLAADSDGLSGADLERLCRRAALLAVRRAIASEQSPTIDQGLLQQALGELRQDANRG
ncbi:MAG: AAA family ATPase [Trueperaceae bacterium]|nr:AAA family ATPase [Trueperaceae bacterium]